jgi:hypothetical protein
MRRIRTAILRCRWGFFPTGWPDPPSIPDETLRTMFSRSTGTWGVAQLWHDATLGLIDFDPAVIFDVGELQSLGITRNPDGSTSNPGRGTVIPAARERAAARGFPTDGYDVVVVMIGPPPSDAGAYGNSVLLDVNGDQSFMAHELGHTLGFDHSWGPAFGNPDAEYCDPYCVMSCDIFGYRAPWADSFPPGTPQPPGLPQGWTVQMGPLPAAAITQRYSEDFANSTAVVRYDLTGNPEPVTLTGYGRAVSPSTAVLAVARTDRYTWLIEYRCATGWDRGIGLGPKHNPADGDYDPTPPGVGSYRQDAAGHIVYVDVLRTDREAGGTWSAADDAFTVRVDRLADDQSWAQVQLGPPRLTAVRVGEHTSPYGVACTGVADVFVNEYQYLGWTGTGNSRPNPRRRLRPPRGVHRHRQRPRRHRQRRPPDLVCLERHQPRTQPEPLRRRPAARLHHQDVPRRRPQPDRPRARVPQRPADPGLPRRGLRYLRRAGRRRPARADAAGRIDHHAPGTRSRRLPRPALSRLGCQ